MRVLLAIASHEVQHVGSLRTCYLIKTREGDQRIEEWRTRGDEAREGFVRHFLEDAGFGDEDGILLLDADQRHPPDMLERLRDVAETHGLDMVCAHYYRRETKLVQSLCYELGDGTYPFVPYLDPPTEGLHEIGCTGFGCVLIRKKVLAAVEATLPDGMSPVAIGPLPELVGDHDNFGPDFRFFYLARSLGFRLWLDAGVESLHGVTLWLGHRSARKLATWTNWANGAYELLTERLRLRGVSLEAFRLRRRILESRKRGILQEFEEVKASGDAERVIEYTIALHTMDGKIAEMDAWIEWAEKYPKVERPDQLPTTENTPPLEVSGGTQEQRGDEYRQEAIDLAACLPELPDVA